MKNFFVLAAFLSFSSIIGQVSLSTNIPSSLSSGSSVDVEVKIQKGTISSFAKYQMDVPEGFSVSLNDSKGGNFTFDQQRAKIVWVSVPSEAEYSIVFKFQVGANAPSQSTFSQKFFYLENGEKKEFEAEPINVTINGGSSSAVASNNESSNNSSSNNSSSQGNVETVKSTPVETVNSTPVETVNSTPVETVSSTPVETVKSTPVETVKSTPVETVSNTSANKTTNSNTSSSSEAGLTYRVQLGAFSSQPNKSKFNSAGNISIDMVDGLYKVTSGNFNTKEEAIKHRDNLSNKGYSGLFIAKYKNGKRVN